MTYLDVKHYGRLLRGLRAVRGYDSAAKVADLIRREGMDISDRTYYSLERGERESIGLAEHFAICVVLHPDPGYFEAAVKPRHGLRVIDDE